LFFNSIQSFDEKGVYIYSVEIHQYSRKV